MVNCQQLNFSLTKLTKIFGIRHKNESFLIKILALAAKTADTQKQGKQIIINIDRDNIGCF